MSAIPQFAPAQAQAAAEIPQMAPNAVEFTLQNGMQVVVIPDHRAPVVTHMVWYKVGAADETAGQSGIAHFLEHLMFKGTTAHPGEQFRKPRRGDRRRRECLHLVRLHRLFPARRERKPGGDDVVRVRPHERISR